MFRFMRRGVVLAAAAAGVFLFCGAPTSAARSSGRTLIRPTGIGRVHFGLPKAEAISKLSSLFGKPSSRFVNSGCGPRYTEVAWGHLYVEFRLGKFSGYRYQEYGWIPTGSGVKPRPSFLPKLATSRGITLASSLRQLRRAYGRLDLIGTDRWMVRGGLVFFDDSKTQPPTASSRIIEIKIGTCGDF
jgi:hypothetical protein